MKCLDLTLPAPAENLACDEALLDWGEATGGEALRFWEPAQPFVVVGYANKVAVEANLPACAWHRVGVFRRCSGGGTVLQGPGCLNYSLVLQIPETGPLASISGTNRFVMERNRAAIEAALAGRAGLAPGVAQVCNRPGTSPDPKPCRLKIGDTADCKSAPQVEVRGHTDLVIEGRKFSGNAQRRRRRSLLFHGTFLCHFDLPLMGKFLNFPSQQPSYRQDRAHSDFLVNLETPPVRIKECLRQAWQAREEFGPAPVEEIERLVREKYATEAWNFKF